jgi:hypothetical protein
MRVAILALVLGACSHATLAPQGDLGGVDQAQAPRDLLTPSRDLLAPHDAAPPDFAASDLSGISCITDCNHCVLGAACCPGAPNSGCCNAGEWCDNGSCRCGMGPGCATGQMCASPLVMQNQCGFICCGNGVPCPL